MLYDDRKRRPSLESVLSTLQAHAEHTNIAEELDDDQLNEIGSEAKREYDIDVESRADWQASAERAMDIALQVRKPKNYPFEGASNIKYPLVTVAALQFGARAYPAIVDGNRIVKGQPIGKDEGGQKRAKAERIGQHMSWQLLYEMEEWEEDTDVLLHHLPIVGCAFRKVWRSDELGRNKAEMVPAVHLVVNNKARSLDEAPRITHELFLYPHEVQERQLNGTFLDIDLPMPADTDASDKDAPHTLLEQHRFIDLDGDGYREPYIVTLHKDTSKVLRIVANYDFEEIKHDGKRITRIPKDTYFVKYSFLPDPKGGFYDVGFGKLLESLSETIDTMINQMIDAGHLQIAGGGFIGSGVRLKKGEIKLSPGKYINVEAPGTVLKDAIVNMEHPGPTAVHMSLLELMLAAATDITAVKDILTGDQPEGRGVQTATTTLAMIEQGLKVFTAIYKRVYRALKQEFKLLFYLNAKHLDEQQYFTVLDEQQAVAKQDYDWKTIDVQPVADPRTVTDMQKMARAQFLREFLGTGLINDQAALLRVFDAVGIENPQELIPQASPMNDLAMQDAASKIDKTVAETEKLKTETAMMPVQAQMQVELEDRQQAQAEQQAAADQAMAQRQQEQAEIEAAAGIVQSEEQLRQSSAGQAADIALQEAGLQQQERVFQQKAQADRAKSKAV